MGGWAAAAGVADGQAQQPTRAAFLALDGCTSLFFFFFLLLLLPLWGGVERDRKRSERAVLPLYSMRALSLSTFGWHRRALQEREERLQPRTQLLPYSLLPSLSQAAIDGWERARS